MIHVDRIVATTLAAVRATVAHGAVDMRALGKALRPAIAQVAAECGAGVVDERQLTMLVGDDGGGEKEAAHG